MRIVLEIHGLVEECFLFERVARELCERNLLKRTSFEQDRTAVTMPILGVTSLKCMLELKGAYSGR